MANQWRLLLITAATRKSADSKVYNSTNEIQSVFFCFLNATFSSLNVFLRSNINVALAFWIKLRYGCNHVWWCQSIAFTCHRTIDSIVCTAHWLWEPQKKTVAVVFFYDNDIGGNYMWCWIFCWFRGQDFLFFLNQAIKWE